MLPQLIASRLAMAPDPVRIILIFFAYSFLGYVLECIVLTIQTRKLVVNRGFSSHLPFCIIYGFGAMAGFALLHPLADRPLLLFLAGAVGATVFEYLVARLQIKLFGDFWWDYNEKHLNYQGIICLESTIGWGLAALLVINVAHHAMVGVVRTIPGEVAMVLAVALPALYLADFFYSARQAREEREDQMLQPGEAWQGKD
ncbi:putative ABC transporter permease [Ruminococcaceae bacterium OttesenSCG-928-A11]|nr:putative ABC transporter permease [Ruminococcaceae bacterium OttesenSCG-928-A11]